MAVLDIALGADGDLAFVGGDLVLVSDIDGIAQLAKLAVSTVLGEWFLDRTIGVDWFGSILVKDPNLPIIREIIRQALLAVPGISEVVSVDVQTFTNRTATISFTARTDLGLINGTVASP